MLVFIDEYIKQQVADGMEQKEIADILGVKPSMISTYKGGSYKPSITVAIAAYENLGVVFHPYSEDSLKHELKPNKER